METFTTSFAAAPPREESPGVRFDVDHNHWIAVPVRAAFAAGPVHCCRCDGLFDLRKAAETFAAQLVRSRFSLTDEEEDCCHGLSVRLDERLYAVIDDDRLFVYSDSPERSRDTAEKLRRTFVRQPAPSRPTFHIIKRSEGSIEAESVRLEDRGKLDAETLALHYGEDFPDWHETFVAQLRAKPAGLSIFDGPPGTGKTSYVRHLMVEMKETHRFYFINSANLYLLRDAEFMSFWSAERRTYEKIAMVVILEDSENALMPRSSANREEVSLLLNITDGILGEFLRLQVICTINCQADELDQALLRPGRLTARRYFGPINRSSAEKLAAKLGKTLPSGDSLTLAEIFSGRRDDARREQAAIGFGTTGNVEQPAAK